MVLPPALRLERVHFCYPNARQPALRDLTLEVPAGQSMALLGPSGCGKTTVLKLCKALHYPQRGKVSVAGVPLDESNALPTRRRIGYVQQRAGLFPHLSCAANVALPCTLAGWPPPRIAARVREVMHWVELGDEDYLKAYPRFLSGGQQQRVALARALAATPQLVLMDEAFSALDPMLKAQLHRLVQRLQQSVQFSLLCVTHDLAEAELVTDSVALMRDGQLVQQGRIATLRAQPADAFVAAFVASPS